MSKKVILLADDDLDDTEMFCEALEKIDSDIICHCAKNGRQLLSMLNDLDQKPDIIFLDLNMPIMNGWECLKELKEDSSYSEIPVMMISTSSHKREMADALSLGAFCYFVKPNNFNDLTKILQVITSNLGRGLKNAISSLHGSEHIFTC